MPKLVSIWLIELVVNIYDFFTLPFYYMIQQPWRVEQEATQIRAKRVEPFTWMNVHNTLAGTNKRTVETLDELFRDSVSTYSRKDCLGVRKILALEYKQLPDESSSSCNGGPHNGTASGESNVHTKRPQTGLAPASKRRVVSKYVMDDKYTWYSFKQIDEMVGQLSAGLVDLCEESLMNSDGSRKILICADTCMQWFLMAHASFRNSVTVVTAYTTLDDEAILHIIAQTEVKILVVSQKFASRVPNIIKHTPLVDTIVILDEPLPGEESQLNELKPLLGATNVRKLLAYSDIVARGKQCKENITRKPTGDDIAVLMYTSGSTGKAKGVMLSHRSIVFTAQAFSAPGEISSSDRYIGYLPLGHVLELAAECIFLSNGTTIAYSSPMTLTNNSPMIKRNQKGDAYIFKPTVMGAVPLVLDRIKNAVQQAVKERGPFYDQLINDFVIRYKRYWSERYYDTPIMNRLLCRKFNTILGNEMRAICSGGAALSRDTQEYLRHVTNYTVLQGYGLTETSAAASFCDINERRYNVVGAPYPIVKIRLESWSDYSVHDKPHPRGEIVIGGAPVASGYYKNDELTKESFYVDEKTGSRYFRTGDIGMMLPDGVLKIIDRKKDIVKPLSGEYISLSEIEVALKTMSIVENICVYCSQYSNYIVALILPDKKELKLIAKELAEEDSDTGEQFRKSLAKAYAAQGTTAAAKDLDMSASRLVSKVSHELLCQDEILTERVTKMIQVHGSKQKLKRNQIPSKIRIVTEEWTAESGLITASFKLRRREIERLYANDIKQLYAALGQKIDQNS